jgi:hypothetical protein
VTVKTGTEPAGGSTPEGSLLRLQTWLLDAIAGGASERDETVRRTATEQLVMPSRFLSATERVSIYHDAYRSRLIECLRDDYPAVEHALGVEPFSDLALAYIVAHPSRSPNLNHFGRHFSAFCRREAEPGAAATLAFAADLAALEWALVEVLHAGAPAPLSAEALAAVPAARWASARFVASPTLRVVSSAFPVNAYYQAWRQEEAPSVPDAQPSATAVYRQEATLWRMDLSRPMAALLRALLDGSTLGAALGALESSSTLHATDGEQVMTWFGDWMRHGFFAAITLESSI